MNLIVKKTLRLSGKITTPSSKSQSIRAIFFALLASGKSTLRNMLASEDTEDAIRVCRSLGAQTNIFNKELNIKSNGLPLMNDVNIINSGNSGITTTFLMPVLGLRKDGSQPILLDCGEQMRSRPVRSLVDALNNLGLTIQYLNKPGNLPVTITGNLRGGRVDVDGTNSQFLSALLISLPCAPIDSEIRVKNLHERPYVEMTMRWLKQQNINCTHHTNNLDIYHVNGKQGYKNFQTDIQGDFSSSSYLIAAAAVSQSHVELEGLDMSDAQGDKKLISILQEMGADIKVDSSRLIIRGGKELKGLKIDANHIPDLLPTLAVIGTYAKGKTEIFNVKQARIKETDRIHSMTEGLRILGAQIDEKEDGLTVYQSRMQGHRVNGYNDHRTVMSLSIAGILAEGVTIIEGGEAINKTFPDFVKVMKLIGANIENETC